MNRLFNLKYMQFSKAIKINPEITPAKTEGKNPKAQKPAANSNNNNNKKATNDG
jgi:hypothetical protein